MQTAEFRARERRPNETQVAAAGRRSRPHRADAPPASAAVELLLFDMLHIAGRLKVRQQAAQGSEAQTAFLMHCSFIMQTADFRARERRPTGTLLRLPAAGAAAAVELLLFEQASHLNI
jgi:EamA domain-containing membrane protein RarD